MDVFVKWKLRFSVCPQARYDALLASSCAGSRTSRTHLSFLKHKPFVWATMMKTNAFQKLKLERYRLSALTLNLDAGFQRDVLNPGFCQASSKMFLLNGGVDTAWSVYKVGISRGKIELDMFSKDLWIICRKEVAYVVPRLAGSCLSDLCGILWLPSSITSHEDATTIFILSLPWKSLAFLCPNLTCSGS